MDWIHDLVIVLLRLKQRENASSGSEHLCVRVGEAHNLHSKRQPFDLQKG
jgi:hypothetical protein